MGTLTVWVKSSPDNRRRPEHVRAWVAKVCITLSSKKIYYAPFNRTEREREGGKDSFRQKKVAAAANGQQLYYYVVVAAIERT